MFVPPPKFLLPKMLSPPLLLPNTHLFLRLQLKHHFLRKVRLDLHDLHFPSSLCFSFNALISMIL